MYMYKVTLTRCKLVGDWVGACGGTLAEAGERDISAAVLYSSVAV